MAAIYCLLTLALMAIVGHRLEQPAAMLLMRAEWAGLTLIAVWASRRWAPKSWHEGRTLRTFIQLGWLSQWYPDTYEFNRTLPSLDHIAATLEQTLFHCQPSLLLSRILSAPLWSEAFHLGYFSYYPMIAALVVSMFAIRRLRPGAMHVATTILAAFFIYYAIYICLPVAGPQYYFAAITPEAAEAAQFTPVGTYFNTHTDMLPSPGWDGGLFRHLVAIAQLSGERPTAAFPSSHVGISTIVMLLSRRHLRTLFIIILPLYLLLLGATVYIQAHYLIDALAGLITAPLVLFLANRGANLVTPNSQR